MEKAIWEKIDIPQKEKDRYEKAFQDSRKKTGRYCTVDESLVESMIQVKLAREGKIKLKSWDEFEAEMRELARKVENGEE